MVETLRSTIVRVNAVLSGLLEEVRCAVRGEGEFTSEEVRKLKQPVEEMAPIIAQYGELRRTQPDLAGELDLYRATLRELDTTLAQVRKMLLARQASLEAGRAQISAVSQWVDAFRQTR